MKKIMPLTVLIAVMCLTGCATSIKRQASLEMTAFISKGDNWHSLTIDIVNRSDMPATILTEKYSAIKSGTNNRRGAWISLDYRIWSFSSDDGVTNTYIPSLPTLAPVTLLKDESAQINYSLDEEYVELLNKPERVFTIKYSISEPISERFSLWHGSLEVKQTVKSLLAGTGEIMGVFFLLLKLGAQPPVNWLGFVLG